MKSNGGFFTAPSISTAIKRYEAQEVMEKLTTEEIDALERWADTIPLPSSRDLLKRAVNQLRNK